MNARPEDMDGEAQPPRPEEILVSVIIPAYNAAATIEETLRSVRSQTHARLEILVVDDGSKDDTLAIVRHHQAVDDRIRLISQPNAGVATARNHGIAEASAEFVAPVDADDLWSPDKIERQLAACLAGGPRVGLVYNWFAMIDPASTITGLAAVDDASGDAFDRLLANNFIGNGSTPLMCRDAVLACGGYDAGLHAQGAQGCEDLKLYLAIAERYHFAVVADYLTGYRIMPGNMSSNSFRMMRSFDLVMQPIAAKYPDKRVFIDAAAAFAFVWNAKNRWHNGDKRQALALAATSFRRYPWNTLKYYLLQWPRQRAINLGKRIGRLRGGDKDGHRPAAIALGSRFPIGTVAPAAEVAMEAATSHLESR